MANKENKNEMLSFEELRKQLGIEKSELPDVKKEDVELNSLLEDLPTEKIAEVKEESKIIEEKTEEESALNKNEKRVVENGKTFVDITEMYVNNEEEVVEEEKKEEEKPVKQKKRVRTFNEIFADFFGAFIPKKKDSAKEKVRKIVMDVSIVAIVCCIVAFGKYFIEYNQHEKQEEGIKELLVQTDGFDENQYVEAWQEIFAQYPNVSFPEGMDLKYSYLYASNQDLVGWLKISNSSLDVQIVQAKDNDYYLNRDFYGKKSRYGNPYLDYKNDSKELDDNTIVYGHHMSDGLMFSQLDKYKTLEGYKESPMITFSTLYETYNFKVFAAFIATDSPATDGGFNYMATDFNSDAKFTEFIDEVRLRSLINTDVSVQTDDKIITLVTCSHEFDNARLVVMGRMIRENESAEVNVSNATLNTAPKYPQAWYDKKNKENPYA